MTEHTFDGLPVAEANVAMSISLSSELNQPAGRGVRITAMLGDKRVTLDLGYQAFMEAMSGVFWGVNARCEVQHLNGRKPLSVVKDLPFKPPFRVLSDYKCGTDAHVVDKEGNVIIESSAWASNPEDKHKRAMHLICDALNDKFPDTNEYREDISR